MLIRFGGPRFRSAQGILLLILGSERQAKVREHGRGVGAAHGTHPVVACLNFTLGSALMTMA